MGIGHRRCPPRPVGRCGAAASPPHDRVPFTAGPDTTRSATTPTPTAATPEPRSTATRSHRPFDGLQAEYARVPYAHTNLVAIPPGVTDGQAITVSGTFPTAWFGARLAEVGGGDVVAIFGAGPSRPAGCPVRPHPGRRADAARRRCSPKPPAPRPRSPGGTASPRPTRPLTTPGQVLAGHQRSALCMR